MSHAPLDCSGKMLKPGDRVRVVGVPDLSGLQLPEREVSDAVFSYLVGSYRRIAEFDAYGHAWLDFRIQRGPLAGRHAVAIEPWLLRLPDRRDSESVAS